MDKSVRDEMKDLMNDYIILGHANIVVRQESINCC